MTRRDFLAWAMASIVAMVAGARVWRLFRRLAEEQRGHLVGVVTEINQALGTVTVSWEQDQHGRRWGIIRGPLVVNRIGAFSA